ncbi:THO complex subunit 4D isoform X2 [Ricinus communis]|uniref:RNA and export factor binding protein, putative n=1 Tax=Ricinus communis TaxID=3988 RepID=B9T100_RICCO|nr:THO complex subunit 4D isoform X2 [Ricinus communis]EEF30463.1 RNA and export factor binding protein, putative [Ricinus communis]|eukprot:XP_002531919.1 THO complex subunit 4D isoform X2 [Ricinus communis]
MSTSVDMSLDDIIKKNRERGRGGRGRARRGRGRGGSFSGGRMTGAGRKGPLSVNARPSQFSIAKPNRRIRNLPWQHDLLEDSIRAAGITGVEVGTKLYVSNLEYGVSNEDIRELFAEIGDLKRYAVHYDKNGRSTGSAEVVYTRRSEAFAALKKYNNVLLDGKPMKIEIVGVTGEAPISARVNVTGINGRRKRTVVMTPGPGRGRGFAPSNRGAGQRSRGGLRNLGRGRGRGRGRGGHGGRGKKQPLEKSADELDKELDTYHAEAMQS